MRFVLTPAPIRGQRATPNNSLQRHGISQLPNVDGEKPSKKKFKV